MGHVYRFYVPPDTPAAEEIVLAEEECHHALHVVRVSAGDPVVLFDGRGREIEGTVRRTGRRDVVIACGSVRTIAAPAKRLALVQGWLLREKSVEFVIQHGTEVGVAHFCFFRARHSEKAPRANPKWERLAIEACKQCGRAWLPTFAVAENLDAALGAAQGTLLLATQHVTPTPLRQAVSGGGAVSLLLGPEGDWADEELALARSRGAISISLGAATYRSEVAAVLTAALVLYELGEMGVLAQNPT